MIKPYDTRSTIMGKLESEVKNGVGQNPIRKDDITDNAMRFSNSDVSLDDVIERNGGHIVLANMDSLFVPFKS
jgi:flagellar biosynthesis/type III secretory pathway M-ring protein FliF/YscJ